MLKKNVHDLAMWLAWASLSRGIYMIYCKAYNGDGALNFMQDIFPLPDKPDFAAVIVAPNLIFHDNAMRHDKPLHPGQYYFLKRNTFESAAVVSMITCTAVIAYSGNSDIFVYHAPSGQIRNSGNTE
ncbi:hypothetical protein FKD06_25285 [Serratia sp. SRS-8-S-2018]|uniref:hypothetical protein n=1 Tax=Serratia sp. SRS-8-S-2018 TaxID=2591107 RepID=UPI00113FE231|nr:hypothetical protein [Serratia sp. SRS-8-S-2018]TPW38732.1 hypothetical protein FKD06_25285 [Serratia sp. SRS-8-S-2018]